MSSWGLVFREGRQRKETGQPQSWTAHPPRRGLYPRRRAKRGTRAHRLPNKSKATCPYFISSFQKQFSGVGEVPCPPPFPQSYCCHLSSLHISYWLSSKGDETLRFHISPSQPEEATQLWIRGRRAMQRALHLRQLDYSNFLGTWISKTHLMWSQGPKGIRVLTTEWKL